MRFMIKNILCFFKAALKFKVSSGRHQNCVTKCMLAGGILGMLNYQRLHPSLSCKKPCASHSRDSTSVALFSDRLPLPQPHQSYWRVFVIFRRLLSFYMSLQTDLGHSSAVENRSTNSDVQFFPLSFVEIAPVNEIEKSLFSGVLDADSALIYPVMTS